tara:strand:- start:486 stop:929 length:444 start_codon:yes stop_codon:yes gene_type:complete
MPSQIKVDEIKNVAGQYKIKTNVFEGQTTAGSIAVQGEGTATTNLQQGLVKTWASLDFANTQTDDSFNVSSITDVATGRQTVVHNNNMGSANYAGGGFSQAVLALYGEATDDPSFMTAAQCQLKNTSDTSSLVDHGKVTVGFFGDLA